MIRHLLKTLTVLALALCTACSKNETTPPTPPPARHTPHTVVVYMPGRSLLSFYRQNIENLRRAVDRGLMGDGRLLFCYQPDSHLSAELCEISYSTKADGSVVTSLGSFEFNASSTDDVAAMLQRAMSEAPADSYGLIVGSHGKAWLSPSMSLMNNSPADGVQSDNLWQPLEGALPTRSFGDSNREMETEAFGRMLAALPHRFDYLIFDACFMANIETLYELRNATDYIVASPCEIMAAGFPYDRMVEHLYATTSSPEARLQQVCEVFYDFYQNDWDDYAGNEQSGCISLCRTASLDDLADIVKQLGAPAHECDPETLQSFEGLANHIFYDFGQYIRTVHDGAPLLDEFERRLEAAFPSEARFNTENFYSAYNRKMNPIAENGYSGVTTSAPALRHRDEWMQTSWYETVN